MRSTKRSSSYGRRQCCRQAHKMRNEMKLSRLIVTAIVVTALPFSVMAQDEPGVRIRGLTQIDTTVRLDRGGAVDLSLISGKIRVTGWDRSDVRISATIESGMLRFSANSSRVSLSVDDSDDEGRRGHRHNNVGEARYDVSVPRGSRLILEAVSGDITSKGSQGEIEATSVSGDVDVTDGVRTVSAEAVSGSVHAAQVNGNLRTETVSGDIVYTGTIEPSGRYSFESHSGTLRLNIPRGAGAQFSVETFSGDLQSDFPVTIGRPGKLGRDGRIEFTIGDG